jgi:hypothetical protein
MFLFGGLNVSDETSGPSLSNDIFAYDPVSNEWEKLDAPGPRPAARYGQAMIYDSKARALLVFGGISFPNQLTESQSPENIKPKAYQDTWKFDLVSHAWKDLKPSGSIPSGIWVAAIYDALAEKTLAYETPGKNGGHESALKTYDLGQNRWAEIKQSGNWPTPRVNPAMVYAPETRNLLLFGGARPEDMSSPNSSSQAFTYFDDVWAYGPVGTF